MLSYGCVLRFWRRDAGGVRTYLPKSSPFLVNLDLNVALSDIAIPRSRVSSDAAPANDDEKMRRCASSIVRPDGTVEANRFVKPSVALVYDRRNGSKS